MCLAAERERRVWIPVSRDDVVALGDAADVLLHPERAHPLTLGQIGRLLHLRGRIDRGLQCARLEEPRALRGAGPR